MSWKRLTVKEYQDLQTVKEVHEDDPFMLICEAICIVYRLSRKQVNEMQPQRFTKLSGAIKTMFEAIPQQQHKKRIGLLKIDYDVANMKWRQYVEMQHFGSLEFDYNFHSLMASAVSWLWQKNNSKKHRKFANKLRQSNFLDVYFSVKYLVECVAEFNLPYKDPEPPPEDDNDENGDEPTIEIPNADFNSESDFESKHGWTYSTKLIADHRGISLDAAYELTARQAMNDLQFIKALQKHEEKLWEDAKAKSE